MNEETQVSDFVGITLLAAMTYSDINDLYDFAEIDNDHNFGICKDDEAFDGLYYPEQMDLFVKFHEQAVELFSEKRNEIIAGLKKTSFTEDEFSAIMSCKSYWVEFETNRANYSLSASDDWAASLKIIAPLKTYHIVDNNAYNEMLKEINKFFSFDGEFYNNDEYLYEELDEFLTELHPILNNCINY